MTGNQPNSEHADNESSMPTPENDVGAAGDLLDSQVLEAMRSIPIPNGLQAKIHAALHAERSSSMDEILGEVTSPKPIANSNSASRNTATRNAATLTADSSPETPTGNGDTSNLTLADSQRADNQPDRSTAALSSFRTPTRWVTTIVLVASCAAVLLGVGWAQSASSPEALAHHAILKVENATQWHATQELPLTTLAFIAQNLQSSEITSLEEISVDAAAFGQSCTIWKLSDVESEVYICAIDRPSRVNQLSEQLRVIQDSGPWSVAAKYSHSDRIFLVITRGDVRRYFRPNRYA